MIKIDLVPRKIWPFLYSFTQAVAFEWEKERNGVNQKYCIYNPRLTMYSDSTYIITKLIKLEELIAQANIIDETKAHRLPWLGHLDENEWGSEREESNTVETDLRILQASDRRETTMYSGVILFRWLWYNLHRRGQRSSNNIKLRNYNYL